MTYIFFKLIHKSPRLAVPSLGWISTKSPVPSCYLDGLFIQSWSMSAFLSFFLEFQILKEINPVQGLVVLDTKVPIDRCRGILLERHHLIFDWGKTLSWVSLIWYVKDVLYFVFHNVIMLALHNSMHYHLLSSLLFSFKQESLLHLDISNLLFIHPLHEGIKLVMSFDYLLGLPFLSFTWSLEIRDHNLTWGWPIKSRLL